MTTINAHAALAHYTPKTHTHQASSAQVSKLMKLAAQFQQSTGIQGKGGVLSQLFNFMTPAKMESLILKSPAFREIAENALGGQIKLDPKADGKFSVEYPGRRHPMPYHPPHARPGAIQGGLNKITDLLQQIAGQLEAGAKPGAGSPGGAGQAGGTEGSSKPSGGDTELAAMLRDPSVPMADKLMAFMFAMLDKLDKKLEDKMAEQANLSDGKTPGAAGGAAEAGKASGGKKKKGGLFGFLGNVAKVAGPIVGGIFGGPIGAKIGGAVGNLAGNALSKAGGGGAAAQAGGAGGAGAAEGGKADSAGGKGSSEEKVGMEIEKLVKQRDRLMTLVSNVMNTLHETQKKPLNNIRV
jgi:hypothetical protein